MFALLAPNMLPRNNLIQVRRDAANGMRGILLGRGRQASQQNPRQSNQSAVDCDGCAKMPELSELTCGFVGSRRSLI